MREPVEPGIELGVRRDALREARGHRPRDAVERLEGWKLGLALVGRRTAGTLGLRGLCFRHDWRGGEGGVGHLCIMTPTGRPPVDVGQGVGVCCFCWVSWFFFCLVVLFAV